MDVTLVTARFAVAGEIRGRQQSRALKALRNMQSHSSDIPGLPSEVRDALVNSAIQKLVTAAGELGVSMQEVQTMLELGMTAVEIVDYLETRLRRRIQ